eukprot:GFUD01005436.1.p1 GENE.GFUD01005436.1~~GFUD01005436.1.p1  ORF type:complete len:507 (+),score=184.69 GFUD01005436.1:185-1705(+)
MCAEHILSRQRMSDSGVSDASSGPSSGISDIRDHKVDELEEDKDNSTVIIVGEQTQLKIETENVKISPSKPKMTSNPYLSKSVMNLIDSSPYLSPSISRSESTCSIASSSVSTSPVTVMEMRTLTNNFQKLLKQATKEIKKLNVEKSKLEQEQGKLLTVNVELAVETKKLLLDQKEWKKDKQDLIMANEEFASEVEKLYKEEDQQLSEKEKLTKELKEVQENLELEKRQLNKKLQKEKEKFELQIMQLTKSMEAAFQENEKLQGEYKLNEHVLSNSQEDIRTTHAENIIKFESMINCLQNDIAQEKEQREDGELRIETLLQELGQKERELKGLTNQFTENQNTLEKKNKEKVIKLKKQNENLTAENFEYVVENEELKKNLNEQLEREKKITKEMSQLKVENQWLINNQKDTAGKSDKTDVKEEELESLKKELKEEMEKVKNLTSWKSQLMEKNKELKDDNERLFNRAEDLERLMNDEVTDINEILGVINTIQVDKKVPELKSKRFL